MNNYVLNSYADIEWRQDGQPLSRAFDDIYFSGSSPQEGLEESRYVFLQQNDLPRRWAELEEGANFTIGETGFGTGLNFLAAWQLWLDAAPQSARLHFVSVEKYPLHRRDLIRALQLWPQLQPFAEQLQAEYPPLLASGVHRLHFDGGRVSLTLAIGEASEALLSLRLQGDRDRMADAWFLDGFTPAKNPAMWTQELFRNIAALSKPNASFATFTCAGLVKRGLKSAGFQLEKVPGYGNKREMLRGRLDMLGSSAFTSTPWYLPPGPGTIGTRDPGTRTRSTRKTKSEPGAPAPDKSRKKPSYPEVAPPGSRVPGPGSRTSIAIIGAGIAGATVARALAERGLRVAVFERGPQPGSGASGNEQGILYAKLSPKPGANGDFNLHALLFALRYYRRLCPQAAHFCGLLQLAQDAKEQLLQCQIAEWLELHQAEDLAHAVSAAQASEIASQPLAHSGLFFPNAGWLEPKAVCNALLQHKNIRLHCDTPIEELQPPGNGWLLRSTARGEFSAAAVIVCTANDLAHFSQTDALPLRPIRGQASSAPATEQSQKLAAVLCAEGYITPVFQGTHSFGATFKLKDRKTDLREEEQRENLSTLAVLLPEIAKEFAAMPLQGRASVRAATPDYLPLAGPVPKWDSLKETYARLGKDRKLLIPQTAEYWPGLFAMGGLGSRGFTYAPLAAEMVAAWLCDEVMPVESNLVKALHPARFAIRALIKNREE